jgi:uncharacterized membrane protein HdeD (DUF308 family)
MSAPDYYSRLDRAVTRSIHHHWKLFLIEGICLLALGILAIVLPQVASLAVALVLGWLFLFSGVVGLVMTFMMRHMPGFWPSLLSALLGIAAGVALVAFPVSGVISLTYVLVAFFIVEGVASIMFALDHRRELPERWSWMLVSGIVDLVLATLILLGLPGSAAWAMGLLVGINMMMGGIALIAMAITARSLDPGAGAQFR